MERTDSTKSTFAAGVKYETLEELLMALAGKGKDMDSVIAIIEGFIKHKDKDDGLDISILVEMLEHLSREYPNEDDRKRYGALLEELKTKLGMVKGTGAPDLSDTSGSKGRSPEPPKGDKLDRKEQMDNLDNDIPVVMADICKAYARALETIDIEQLYGNLEDKLDQIIANLIANKAKRYPDIDDEIIEKGCYDYFDEYLTKYFDNHYGVYYGLVNQFAARLLEILLNAKAKGLKDLPSCISECFRKDEAINHNLRDGLVAYNYNPDTKELIIEFQKVKDKKELKVVLNIEELLKKGGIKAVLEAIEKEIKGEKDPDKLTPAEQKEKLRALLTKTLDLRILTLAKALEALNPAEYESTKEDLNDAIREIIKDASLYPDLNVNKEINAYINEKLAGYFDSAYGLDWRAVAALTERLISVSYIASTKDIEKALFLLSRSIEANPSLKELVSFDYDKDAEVIIISFKKVDGKKELKVPLDIKEILKDARLRSLFALHKTELEKLGIDLEEAILREEAARKKGAGSGSGSGSDAGAAAAETEEERKKREAEERRRREEEERRRREAEEAARKKGSGDGSGSGADAGAAGAETEEERKKREAEERKRREEEERRRREAEEARIAAEKAAAARAAAEAAARAAKEADEAAKVNPDVIELNKFITSIKFMISTLSDLNVRINAQHASIDTEVTFINYSACKEIIRSEKEAYSLDKKIMNEKVKMCTKLTSTPVLDSETKKQINELNSLNASFGDGDNYKDTVSLHDTFMDWAVEGIKELAEQRKATTDPAEIAKINENIAVLLEFYETQNSYITRRYVEATSKDPSINIVSVLQERRAKRKEEKRLLSDIKNNKDVVVRTDTPPIDEPKTKIEGDTATLVAIKGDRLDFGPKVQTTERFTSLIQVGDSITVQLINNRITLKFNQRLREQLQKIKDLQAKIQLVNRTIAGGEPKTTTVKRTSRDVDLSAEEVSIGFKDLRDLRGYDLEFRGRNGDKNEILFKYNLDELVDSVEEAKGRSK